MAKGKKRRVLIVDDEPDVVTYLSTFVGDHGFAVISALDGHEGFKLALSEQPDLISLDITMPLESGVKMYQNLQENPRTKHIPVIIITGTPGEFDQLFAPAEQLDPPAGYFEKPVDRTML